MNEKTDRLTNGRRTLECIARQYSMPENADQQATINFYASRLAYTFAECRSEACGLLRHYRYMRGEYAKHTTHDGK